MDVEPACFETRNRGETVRLGVDKLVRSMVHAWTDADGLGGEADVPGHERYIENRNRERMRKDTR